MTIAVAIVFRRRFPFMPAAASWWAFLTQAIDAVTWVTSRRDIWFRDAEYTWSWAGGSVVEAGWPFRIELPPGAMGADIPPISMWPAAIGDMAVAGTFAAVIIGSLVYRYGDKPSSRLWRIRWRLPSMGAWLIHAFTMWQMLLWFD